MKKTFLFGGLFLSVFAVMNSWHYQNEYSKQVNTDLAVTSIPFVGPLAFGFYVEYQIYKQFKG